MQEQEQLMNQALKQEWFRDRPELKTVFEEFIKIPPKIDLNKKLLDTQSELQNIHSEIQTQQLDNIPETVKKPQNPKPSISSTTNQHVPSSSSSDNLIKENVLPPRNKKNDPQKRKKQATSKSKEEHKKKKLEKEPEKPVVRDLCKFFLTGHCYKGDSCPFLHDKKLFPCKFFHLYNNCKKGELCEYSHQVPLSEEYRQLLINTEKKKENLKIRSPQLWFNHSQHCHSLRQLSLWTIPQVLVMILLVEE
ncbi:hypothetical protein C9374_002683 [Naegleria lovaniensis]|uniref:C3H1-type domain-containing protein n=1 Tax=Naegleria lovaniensis TaxID=51637 RepID=A0AA88GSJ0_NAELO|nr:uncharacterized protein C9374_002683 [Naegleria lovaniensis]KAG2386237.1 hypothetical protein C9374_002683 [Naegleria lovaniensis]